ncbi:MAG: DEAD/DEAH box helicase family protein [Candidatus Aenigmatarchaeota archaeon]
MFVKKLILQKIAENIDKNQLSFNWQNFDLDNFSENKKLYDFQKEALENALKILWFYYDKKYDYFENENLEINEQRKKILYEKYLDWGLNPQEVSHKYKEERKHKFIFDYYELENNEISFKHFINRMSFWMSTGSGKTLVIIKLIEILKNLIQRREIPDYDILFLTHREDLIKQFQEHLDEYNKFNIQNRIELCNFKDYEKIKSSLKLFKENIVFYYRSDLFSDEEKEKIIDFRNYYNEGKWYLILDEAHKGDKDESKRQHIYSILSQNGFLFNFSATFDDIRDLVTCVYEFNLSSFIEKGFGKKIYIFERDIDAFRNKEDFDDLTKQKIILKALILLTYIKKNLEEIRKIKTNLYHKPLILVLVNSVDNELADLKKIFKELEKIGKGKVEEKIIEEAKNEIIEELNNKKEYILPNEEIEFDDQLLQSINYRDILRYVFNSEKPGEIEISFNPSNDSEVAFKLKTSDSHFCLSKTGQMPNWLKNELLNFEVNHTFENEGFFERVNDEESSVNILLGSRVFYEGWDSNRPNIIMFINIGTQKNARKFVLQSIGRGVRIEPVKNQRKRGIYIDLDPEFKDVFQKIKDFVPSIETLFIFGTNKSALETILKETEEFKKETKAKKEISLFKNEEIIKDKVLLIPKYKLADKKLFEESEVKSRFKLSQDELSLVREFYEFIKEERILLVNYNVEPKLLKFVKNSFERENEFYKFIDQSIVKNPVVLLNNIFNFWNKELRELEKIEELKDEIKHYEKIIVELEEADFKNFENLIKNVFESKKTSAYGRELDLKYIPQHYYLPLILQRVERVEYIKHIIKTKSEIKFIEELEKYIASEESKFNNFDWWLFSKIDENLDDVYIPYYNYEKSQFENFKPDFIFWLKRGNDYYIVFVDPKSTSYRNFEDKVLGYKEIFEEENKPKKFQYKNLNCYIFCFLYTEDEDRVRSSGYKDYWFENFDTVLKNIVNFKNH